MPRLNELTIPVLVPSVLVLVALAPVGFLWRYMELPTGDAYRYLILSDWFSDSISNGIWYPRWLPDMNGGYGYPQFVFYQPGYFYLSHLFVFVEAPLLRAALTLSLVAGIGAWGAYRLARCFSGRATSLFFVSLFQLTPYHFVQLYARGDFSEWTAMALSPWPLYFLYRLGQETRRTSSSTWLVTGLAAVLTVMCYAHPITLLGYLPIFVLMGALVSLSFDPNRRRALAGHLLVAIALAVAVSSPYWSTVVTMARYANIGAAQHGHFDPLAHLLSPLALFWSERDPLSASLRLSFELGPIHFLLAVSGAYVGRREPFILAASCMYGLLLVLMTAIAAPFWKVYPFYLMQFPWRLLSFVAAFQFVCILGIAKARSVPPVARIALGIGLVTLCLAWHSDEMVFRPIPNDTLEMPETRRMILESFPDGVGFVPPSLARPRPEDITIMETNARRAVPFTSLATLDGGEWSPLSALHHALKAPRGQSMVDTLSGAATVVPTASSSKFKLDYLIQATESSTLLVNQLYLPGWNATVDGIARSQSDLEEHVAPDGRIRLSVAPGTHRLTLWYGGAPGWWWRNLLGAIAVACCIGLMVKRHIRVGAMNQTAHT